MSEVCSSVHDRCFRGADPVHRGRRQPCSLVEHTTAYEMRIIEWSSDVCSSDLVGGTHARVAIAEVEKGRVAALGEPITLRTAEHGSLQLAWRAAQRELGRPFPRAAGIAVASPINDELIKDRKSVV